MKNGMGTEVEATAKEARAIMKRSGGRAKAISHSELAKYFHLPIDVAAKELKMCVTVLKKQCRLHGIKRWPHRKLRALDKMAQKLQDEDAIAADPELYRLELQSVRERKKEVMNTGAPPRQHPKSPMHGGVASPIPQHPSAAMRQQYPQAGGFEDPRAVEIAGYKHAPPHGGLGACKGGCTDCMVPGPTAGYHSSFPEVGYSMHNYPYSMPYGGHYGPYPYPPQRYMDGPEGNPQEMGMRMQGQYGRNVSSQSYYQNYPSHVPQEYWEQNGSNCEDCYMDSVQKMSTQRKRKPSDQQRSIGLAPTSQITNEVGSTGNDEGMRQPVKRGKTSTGGHTRGAEEQRTAKNQHDSGAGSPSDEALTEEPTLTNMKYHSEAPMNSLHSLALASSSMKQIGEQKKETKKAAGNKVQEKERPASPRVEADGLPMNQQLALLEKSSILSSIHMNVFTADKNLVVMNSSGSKVISLSGAVIKPGLKLSSPGGNGRDRECSETYKSALKGILSKKIFDIKGKQYLQVTGPLRDTKESERVVGICGAVVEIAAGVV